MKMGCDIKMILDLNKYRADAPYPSVGNVRKDKKLAATLMEGYSGEMSELTTVLQYAYHSLRCKRRHNAIYEVLRGIFYIETIHMELLGDCIAKLGANTEYTIRLREKTICWQAAVVEYESSPAKMLLADIQGEKGAVAFYEGTAATLNQPDIAKLLMRLAEDERLHVKLLTDLYHTTFR